MSNVPVNVDFSQDGNSVFENVYITGILDAASSTGSGIGGFSGNDLSIPGNFHVTGLSTFVGDVDVNNLLIRKHLDIGVGGTFLNASAITERIGIGTTTPTSLLQIGIGSHGTVISAGGTVGIGTSGPFPFSIVEPQGQKLYEGGIGATTMYAQTRYYWTVPKGVYSISVVCIGGGAGGGNSDAYKSGGGGALAYKTSISVTPGNVHIVDVGSGGEGSTNTTTAENGTAGGKSIFYESDNVTKLCSAEYGSEGSGGGGTERIGTGGGNGGDGVDDTDGSGYKHWGYGGGGAGGYDGSGGHGGKWDVDGRDGEEGAGFDGTGGGGGGGGAGENGEEEAGGGGGGGVGVFGEQDPVENGEGGESTAYPGGGFGGSDSNSGLLNGKRGDLPGGSNNGGDGGYYGGGGGKAGNGERYGTGPDNLMAPGGDGGRGAVRIVWGPGRSYPSTDVNTDKPITGAIIAEDGPIKLDVQGTIRIKKNIIDSSTSTGDNGYYLSRDANGIRWQQASPVSLEGLYVQDSGVTLPSTDTARLFTYLNFDDKNSGGTGTQNVIPIPDPSNPLAIAKIQVQDYWGWSGSDIYRMSKVGVQNNAPTQTFEVGSGTTSFVVTGEGKVGIKTDSPYTPLMLQVGSGEGSISRNFVVTGNGSDWGRVGIGTTFPTDSHHLDVYGSARIGGDSLIYGNITLTGDNKTFIIEKEDGTNKFTVSSQTGNTDIEGTLGVKGNTDIDSTSDPASSSGTAALDVAGGAIIGKKVFIKDITAIESTQNSSSTTDGALVVTGGVGIGLKLNVGSDLNVTGNSVLGSDNVNDTTNIKGVLTVESTTDSTTKDTGAVIVEGGVGVEKSLNIGNNLNVSGVSTFVGISTFNDEVGIAKTLTLGDHIIDINNDTGVGVAKTDYRLASVGTGVSWRPSGVQTKNAIWVSMNGMDTNSGLLEGDAKKTIGAAATIAQAGDTIIVRSGVYYENNPVGLRTEVTISGEDLRLVTVVPNNVNKDVFQVRAGCLIQNLNFAGQTSSTDHKNCGAVAFPPTSAGIAGGIDYQAVTGYTELGPANQGPDRIDPSKGARYRSPYVRNCTNFMTGSVGMKINGDYVNAAFTGTNDLGQDLKSMVCDSFTQYNEAGIGVSLTNNAYAQLVSIFTIGCDIAIFAGSGGQCDLTNSNSSFGNFGLKADGIGDVEFTGSTDTASIAGQDTIAIKNVRDTSGNIRKPFDGQGVYFKINLDNYADATGSGTITAPLQFIRSIDIVDGGSGYNLGAPPNVTIPAPEGPEAILPEFSANVGTDGSITSVDVIASGRNFLADQDFTVTFSSGNATAKVNTDPILYTVSEASEPDTVTGLTNVTFNEFIPYNLNPEVDVDFSRLSRIITSSHSFEYVGAGTDLNRANPFQGGEPIPENEIVAINGGQVPFTSTDQKGNFRIGEGLTIDQTTSTIRGRDFNRAIQAQLTPLILALR